MATRERLRDGLCEWEALLQAKAHLLLRRPTLLFQEAANEPDTVLPARTAKERHAAGFEKRPFLLRTDKSQRRSPCLMTLAGHTREVSACACSPDGRRIVSGSADGTLRLWNRRTGELLAVLAGHGHGGIAWCEYSPDGTSILSSVGEIPAAAAPRPMTAVLGGLIPPTFQQPTAPMVGDISLWDGKSGAHLRVLTLDARSRGKVACCAFSPDGSRILAGGGEYSPGWLKVWERATGLEIVSVSSPRRLCGGAWSHDGRRILAAWDEGKALQVLDSASGRVEATLRASGWDPVACASSPDGTRMLFADTYHLWLFDAQRYEPLRDFEPPSFLLVSCGFSPDSSRVVSRSVEAVESAVTLWDPQTGEQVACLGVDGSTTESLAFSPDGSRLATALGDGTIRVWDPDSGAAVATLSGHGSAVTSCGFSPDGKLLVSASKDRTLKVWDLSVAGRARETGPREEPAGALVVCPDGLLATVSREAHPVLPVYLVKRWSAESGDLLTTSRLPLPGRQSTVRRWAFSPNGRFLVSCGSNGQTAAELIAWDARSGEKLGALSGHERGVWDCDFSPDGRRLASVDGADLRIWDTTTLAQVACVAGHEGQLGLLVKYVPGGRRLVTQAGPRGLLIVDGETGMAAVEIPDGDAPCAVSPDGSLIAARVRFRPRVFRICRSATGEVLAELPRLGSDSCEGCGFSPDGRLLAAASRPELRLFGVRSGREIAVLPAESPFSFSPDGRMIAAAGGGERLAVWDLAHLTLVCEQETDGRVLSVVWRQDSRGLVVSGGLGRVQFLQLENVVAGPPAVTAWTWDGRCAYGCPLCRTWSETAPAPGSEVRCPQCDMRLALNPTTVEADWKPVADAWRSAGER